MDILLVDDNADFLFLVKQVLDQNGYTVHTAKDGMEGCEVLTKSDIDLIISDIRMPRLDGLKMHAFAREIDRYKNTKFIFISGFRDVYSHAINIDPKLDFLLDKTTPIDVLLKLVDQLIFGRVEGAWN
jgi:two-component system, OmpR family, alkaline phosphatase synthesis response regulator PhoP